MSILTIELERYLAIRRSLGFELDTSARVLRRFVAFAERQGAEHVTSNLFVHWMTEFGTAKPPTWSARLGMVRVFAQWLNGLDPRHEVPPSALIPARHRRSQPHIYSEEEVARIIDAAGRLPSPNGIRALTYRTLFGLIAVTGLRISEALALNNTDMDWEQGVLNIRCGKSGKQRLAPVSASTAEWLAAYAAERDRLLGHRPESLFADEDGNRPGDCAARYNFASVCQSIGLRPPQRFLRHGRGPRIHDLRHTFAVRTLLGWYRSGMDPEREMLKLSNYLGHASPSHTYWYIEAVPELLELAMQRASRSLAQEGSP